MQTTTSTEAAVYPPAGHIRIVLEAGRHPATGRPLAEGKACGGCVHLTARASGDGSPRSRRALAVSRRGGPDVHPTYPGCDRHETAA